MLSAQLPYGQKCAMLCEDMQKMCYVCRTMQTVSAARMKYFGGNAQYFYNFYLIFLYTEWGE